jgi:hypothetical protein
MNDERGHWYLLTGVLIGAVMGLLYAWVVQPVQYTNTSPASLRADFKDYYRLMIASAYMANGDLVRAKARLELLKDADMYRSLAEQAQRTLAEGKNFEQARVLGMLAAAIQKGVASQPTIPAPSVNPILTQDTPTPPTTQSEASGQTTIQPSPTPSNPTESPPTPTASIATSEFKPTMISPGVPLATLTPTATPGAPYALANREQICDQNQGQNLIQVFTQDAAGQPVPGVEIIVTWQGGENHFFTGLNPAVSVGYADFSMTPGITYTLRIAEAGQTISGLAAYSCENVAGSPYWGNWRLEFVQP